eukprot:TRINITY_DN6814_c0_g1_i1.p1 TRINITY_DN6814_c0_g1~~TRINITY_DN6814_c0_g1_i1.p1  ORF type:complete len:262 (-),score=87.72 TRINITY_DN6814_c0_g1_i1:33-818(-)
MGFKATDNVLVVESDVSSQNGFPSSQLSEHTQKITQQELSNNGSLKDSSFDGVVLNSSQSNSSASFTTAFKLLKSGGTLIVREPIVKEGVTTDSNRTEKQLFLALTLAGFVDTKVTSTENGSNIEITSSKPQFEIGASQAIKFSLNRTPKTTEAPKVWKLDDDEIEDEDALLDEEDKAKPVIKPDDCEVGKGGVKKACKNCTCGRKEEEEEEQRLTTPAPKSACGNCYLGDAFRCGGCPYRGTPAFKPGEKVELSLDVIDV